MGDWCGSGEMLYIVCIFFFLFCINIVAIARIHHIREGTGNY